MTRVDGPSDVVDGETAELGRRAWIDRDLSWLEFNRRVLSEALDERNPLLERVKFLAIFSSNLDEFFMKRMAIIRPLSEDTSLAAEERRNVISREAGDDHLDACRTGGLLQRCHPTPARRARDPPRRLGGSHRCTARGGSDRLRQGDLTCLTPLSLDDAHPFPYVSNLSTSWAFRLEDPVSGEALLVRLKVPRELPQWLRVRAGVDRRSVCSLALSR